MRGTKTRLDSNTYLLMYKEGARGSPSLSPRHTLHAQTHLIHVYNACLPAFSRRRSSRCLAGAPSLRLHVGQGLLAVVRGLLRLTGDTKKRQIRKKERLLKQ